MRERKEGAPLSLSPDATRRARSLARSLALSPPECAPPTKRTDQHHGVALAVGDDAMEGVFFVVQDQGWGWRHGECGARAGADGERVEKVREGGRSL